jgi:hypothetical protein
MSKVILRGMQILTPVSPGEFIDKITILEIKMVEISDPEKRKNVAYELALLTEAMQKEIPLSEKLIALHTELRAINKKIWDTENDVREFWNDDVKFLIASRGSHFENDERARIKREINQLLGSHINEVKSHPTYEHKIT